METGKKTTGKYVILQGVTETNWDCRFFTGNEAPTRDHTRISDGTVAYKVTPAS